MWFQVHWDGSPAGSASVLVVSVSWKESLPVSLPRSPVTGRDLPVLRLGSLCKLGTPMDRCYVSQGSLRNRTNRMCILKRDLV